MRNYEFVLRGEIGDRFGLAFEGMRLERAQGNTVLTGAVLDQAHLHGVIERIQELGMELVSVNPVKGPQMSSQACTPDTIVLLHGFWVTPRSWEHWIDHYRARGFRVLAPAYPGFEVEVEALNADPSPIEAVTVPQIIEHFESVIGELDSPPIVMGHSAGGAFTQIVLDHGFGAAGVAINSAPDRGRRRGPALAGQGELPGAEEPRQPPPRGRVHVRAVALRVHQHVQRGAVPRAVRALPHPRVRFDLLGQRAGQHPPRPRRHLRRLPQRRPAPLLFISGSDDHLMPPKIQQSNAKHYKSDTITEVMQFEGPHLLPAKDGWEEVADYALDWALGHATKRAATSA